MHHLTEREIILIKKRIREDHRTQEDVADYMGISPITFSRWMNGKVTKIRDANWKLLINKLGGVKDDGFGEIIDDGFDYQESVVASKITESWNEYLKLEMQHDDDIEDFRHAIHQLQHLIMIRQESRHRSYWANKNKEST